MIKKPTYEELEKKIQALEQGESERQQAEEALQQSEERYRSLVENTMDGYFICEIPSGQFLFLNKRACSIFGYTMEEGLRMPVWNVMSPEDHERIQKRIQARLEGKPIGSELQVYTAIRKGRSTFPAEISTSLVTHRGVPAVQGLIRDITERQQAEWALRESEERFRQVYQHIAVGIAQISLEFRIEGANQAYCSMLGYREKELIGKHLRGITHSESVEENLRKQSQLATGEIDHYRMEKRFVHKSGHVIHGILDANLVRNSEGKPLYFIGSVLDITKRKQTHEALRKTAEALQLIIDCSPAAIISLDRDTNVTMWNTAAEHIFGWKKEELMGKPYPAVPKDNQTEFRSILRQQLNGKGLTGEVLRRQRKDGSQFYVSTSTAPLRDINGDVIGILSIMIDITKRKHAEDALSESEERLKIAGGIAYDLIYEWIVADEKLIWFGNIDEKLGYDRNEIPNTIEGWLKLIHPEDLVRLKDAVELHRTSTTQIDYKYRVQHKDGSWKYWSDKGLPILNNKGRPYKWIGVCTDITERKEAAEAIRKSEKRLQSIVNNAVVGIYQVTEEGKFLLVNPRLAQMFGFKSPEEFLASVENISQLYANPEERPLILEKIKAEGFVDGVEIEFRNRDGQIVFTMVSVRVIEDKTKRTIYEGFMADITKRKQAEELVRTQRDLSLVIGNTFGLDETLRLCLETAISISGMDCGGVYLVDETSGGLDLAIYKDLPPDFISNTSHYEADSPNAKLVMAGRPIYGEHLQMGMPTEEFRIHEGLRAVAVLPVRHEDRVIASLNVASHVLDAAPTFARAALEAIAAQMGSAITRVRAVEALRESEERYRMLFEGAADGILVADIKTKEFIYANPAICRILGYAEKELKQMTIADIHPKEYLEHVISEFESQARGDKSLTRDIPCLRKDGITIYTDINTSKILINEKECNIAFFTDITARKQAEKALRESEEKLARSKKMESLGLLAGGVAHDLNNVLSGIVGYPELLLMDLPQNSKLRAPIETIQASGHRAVAIIQDLLTVARGVAISKKPLNLNELVSSYLHSPEFKKLEQFHPAVTIKTDLDTELFNINGSHVHIRKVVMNLMSNASEAIAGSGNVTISTMNRYIDRPLRGYDDVNIGEYVILSVSDDGPGISSDDLERMFEPFYTKKILGRSGTGLGLTVVWNALQDHNGYIDVTSDENGTTFECYFPVTREEITDKDLSISIEDIKGNGETILVVDDVESQREISCKMLDTLGYKTKAVSSGEEAVEYLKEHTVDLILLDMIMDPGINGRETYERIIKIHANQKAIIVSGFAETEDVKEAQELGAGKFIKKPFMLERIGLAVKEELEK